MMINRHPNAVIALFSLALAGAFFLAACGGEEEVGPPPTFDFSLEVEATDVDDNPVSGVPVLVDEQLVGFTDAGGLFRATVNEVPGTLIHLAAESAEGYALMTENPRLESELRLTQGMDGQPRGVPTTLRVQLQSVVYDYMTWINVDCDSKIDDEHCKGLAILFEGEEIARTDSRGYAHFSFEGYPGETRELQVLTPEPGEDKPTFKPANPSYELELGANPVVFHVAESFTDPTVEERPRRRRTRRPARTQPRQQQQQQQTQPSDSSQDSDGVLCLFGDC